MVALWVGQSYKVYRIYFKKQIEPLYKNSICKKLLFKLTKGCVLSVTGKLLKQVDGCPMGGPVFSDIFMCKMEFDVVVPAKPIFYKCYFLMICMCEETKTM